MSLSSDALLRPNVAAQHAASLGSQSLDIIKNCAIIKNGRFKAWYIGIKREPRENVC